MKASKSLVAASLALAGLVTTQAHAQGNGNPFAALEAQIAALQGSLSTLQSSLASLHTKVDALTATPAPEPGLIPFAVQASGGICDTGPSPSSNPQIVIDGSGNSDFVVTSILVKTATQAGGAEGYTYITTNSISIDGTLFDTRTGNLFAEVDGFGVNESADLMGMPVRIESPFALTSSPRQSSPAGGNFPHQVVANGAGASDIVVRLFCRSDVHDLSIDTVRVSGWKVPGTTITVTYQPGT